MEGLIAEIRQKCILHWNCRGFSQLPDELKAGETVKEIYLKWNNLSCLPVWISKLKNLTNLYLPHNLLSCLPKELCELSKLNILDLTNNRLQNLPEGLGHLSHLTHFLAAHNELSSVPSDFQMLQSLQILDLSCNNLTRFPEAILECHSLQELLLDNNNLTALPDNIVYFPYLENLSINGNNIHYLPFQPFMSNPALSFDNNPNLNYLSIWLGQQISSRNPRNSDISWDLAQKAQVPRPLYDGDIAVQEESLTRRQYLTLPSSLEYVYPSSSCLSSVPSLLELTIRKVYSMISSHTIKRDEKNLTLQRFFHGDQLYLCLPRTLKQQLLIGPVTLCYHCHEFIFRYGVLWVIRKNCFHENVDGHHMFYVLTTVVFCSVTCSLSYSQWERQNNVPENLESKKLVWNQIKF